MCILQRRHWATLRLHGPDGLLRRSQRNSIEAKVILQNHHQDRPERVLVSLHHWVCIGWDNSSNYVLTPFLFAACPIEHPSNSSLSTTTSSVTSMTSLEHESNETSVSASDYGNENWDNENWGEMDVWQNGI